MPNNIFSLGLDLSLTGTGIILLKDGKIEKQGLIKSKPTPNGKPVDEVRRIVKIVEEIKKYVLENPPDIAIIENLAFGIIKTVSLTQLAALSYFTRFMLMEQNIPFCLVAPNSLKKFITGNGKAKKDEIMLEIYKRYRVSITNDNEADAYGLSQVGLCLKGGNTKQITKFQQEVLDLLKKQL